MCKSRPQSEDDSNQAGCRFAILTPYSGAIVAYERADSHDAMEVCDMPMNQGPNDHNIDTDDGFDPDLYDAARFGHGGAIGRGLEAYPWLPMGDLRLDRPRLNYIGFQGYRGFPEGMRPTPQNPFPRQPVPGQPPLPDYQGQPQYGAQGGYQGQPPDGVRGFREPPRGGMPAFQDHMPGGRQSFPNESQTAPGYYPSGSQEGMQGYQGQYGQYGQCAGSQYGMPGGRPGPMPQGDRQSWAPPGRQDARDMDIASFQPRGRMPASPAQRMQEGRAAQERLRREMWAGRPQPSQPAETRNRHAGHHHRALSQNDFFDWMQQRDQHRENAEQWRREVLGTGRAASGMDYWQFHPAHYKRTDLRIYEDICDALTDAPDLDATDIEVKVENGDVTLTGAVDRRHDKYLTEDIANTISGVKDVFNELRTSRRQGRGSRETSEQMPAQSAGDPKSRAPDAQKQQSPPLSAGEQQGRKVPVHSGSTAEPRSEQGQKSVLH